MALRDQPYIPLYIQDFLTDEKLIECSAASTGVYIRLMCIMHKSEEYGKILLKQKDKQTSNQIENFAQKLVKQMPFTIEVIRAGLGELIHEGVLILEGDFLAQKRMIHDNLLSIKRAKAGSKGGKFAQAKIKANTQATPENEIANDIDNEINNTKEFDFSKPDILGDELVYPIDTTAVRQLWAKWKEYRWKEHKKRYGMMGEQADLKRLSRMTFEQIEKTVLDAISGRWENLYPGKNNSNGARINGNSKEGNTSSTAEYLKQYYSDKAKQQ